jgi:putative nucleotidyltransferase with HDIG domain
MTHDEALALLRTHIKAENLVAHMRAVEAAMRAYARKFGQDEEKWGLAGLLHDIDYETCPLPAEHSVRGAEWLAAAGLPDDVVYAVKAHGAHPEFAREGLMTKTLCAVDALAGFVAAVALVRPSKKIADVEPKSVTKKMKDKAFAAACNRDEMKETAAALGVDFHEHVAIVLDAMKSVADEIGL